MNSQTPKVVRMMQELVDACKMQATQNVVSAARTNEIKVTNEDMQKIVYLINSSVENIVFGSQRLFEDRIDVVLAEVLRATPKSDKKSK